MKIRFGFEGYIELICAAQSTSNLIVIHDFVFVHVYFAALVGYKELCRCSFGANTLHTAHDFSLMLPVYNMPAHRLTLLLDVSPI